MRYSIHLCLLSIVIFCLTENLVTNATKGRLDEQSDLCSDYEPRYPIPKKLNLISKIITLLQSIIHAGSSARSWFTFFQASGMAGAVIPKGTTISLGEKSSRVTFSWYGSDKVPISEAAWSEMEKKCNDCVINRIDCRWAKERLFEQLEREKSDLGWFSSIQKEKLNADENWESFVRLSCRCFPIFKNKLKEGEGSHEKELASLFSHYVPYFYIDGA